MLQMHVYWNDLYYLSLSDMVYSKECLRLLVAKFPESPRVDVLAGIRMEATEAPATCLTYYEGLLEADPANAVSLVSSALSRRN